MVISTKLSEGHRTAPRNIYERRAYSAGRALIAIERYSFLASAQKSDEEKQRTLRWMRVWMAFAVSYGESSFETANRIALGRR